VPVESLDELREAVALYMNHAAGRLRRFRLAAGVVTVFINTNRFSPRAAIREHHHLRVGVFDGLDAGVVGVDAERLRANLPPRLQVVGKPFSAFPIVKPFIIRLCGQRSETVDGTEFTEGRTKYGQIDFSHRTIQIYGSRCTVKSQVSNRNGYYSMLDELTQPAGD
jgi:hypothetical protein